MDLLARVRNAFKGKAEQSAPTPAAPGLPRGTVTFLLTDIEGSSAKWEKHPDAMRPALVRHHALLREAVARHGGHVFKDTGDGVLVAFASASDALSAALDAQGALEQEAWPPDAALKVRMALHTGAAEARNGDYHGPALNRLARLASAGHGGQILVSRTAAEVALDSLPGGASLRDLGAVRLRDLARPETIYQLVHAALPDSFPPLRSLESLPNNLPPETTSFVGRETEMSEVKAALAASRLLTLAGAGGSGKTRLALHVAGDLLTGDGDGVWLVELASVCDPALVPQAVAHVLGVREEPGRPLRQTLTEWLRDKCLLLILDNCEHLRDACAGLAADLLRGCPQVTVLASSREALGVAGERVYRVPSLSLPDIATATEETLGHSEAARLFLDRARMAAPAFRASGGEAGAVALVCQRLDGIPLALELAAARVRAMSVGEINDRLDDRFHLLTGGARTALPRQQTLRALVDWSYDLLDGPEQAVLRRLSVFAGGLSLAAGETVCAGEGVPVQDVLDILTSLVDKSLVIAEPGAGGTRYRLLETVRQYSADRLSESGGRGDTRARHRDWFLALAQTGSGGRGGADAGAWLDRLETDHDNLRTALEWCLEDRDGADKGLRLAGAMGWFWEARGYLSEGRMRLTDALARPGADARTSVRAGAVLSLGHLAQRQGDPDVARSLSEEALALYQENNDRVGEANAWYSLGTSAWYAGDLPRARDLLEKSLALCHETGDRTRESYALNGLAIVAAGLGDLATERTLLEQSLALARAGGSPSGIALVLLNLGANALVQNSPAQARTRYSESLALLRGIGIRGGEVMAALEGLASVALRQGQPDEARTLLSEGLRLCREIGDRRSTAPLLERRARLSLTEHAPDQAARLLGASSALREWLGQPIEEIDQAGNGADIAAAQAALGEAAFAREWAGGRAQSWEQAVDEALAETTAT